VPLGDISFLSLHSGTPIDQPGRRAAANLLTRHEARGIAIKMAKLPERGQLLLGRNAKHLISHP
jgi:hypothetical protein